jgi:zinc transporter 1/2/3
MFEGLGLGSRLAFLQLPEGFGWVPFAGALAYSIMTPLGIAIGLGVREGLSMEAAGASIASGVLDAISSGEYLACLFRIAPSSLNLLNYLQVF